MKTAWLKVSIIVAAMICMRTAASAQQNAAERVAQQVSAMATADSSAGRRAAIEARLRSIGLQPRLSWFDVPATGSAPARRGANVVADIPGPGRELLLLGAHYDRVGVGQGAIDNAAGVAAVLELAEAFARQPLTHYTVRVALFDLEEIGLRGSRAMVADSVAVPLPSIMLNLDIFGFGDALWLGATDNDGPLPSALRQAAQRAGTRIVVDPMYPSSDHLSFRPTRTKSYALSLLDYRDIDFMLARFRNRAPVMRTDSVRVLNIIHSPMDTIDQLDAAAVARGVQVVESALRALDAAQRPR